MAITDFNLIYPIRVRWSEIDSQNIVFNGHYLNYFDIAITEYWRAVGVPYPDGFVQKHGCDLFAVKATVEYHGSARFDEVIQVCARAVKIGRSSITMQMAIYRQTEDTSVEHLTSGEMIYVCANPDTKQSMSVPDSMRVLMKQFEKITIE